MVRCTSTPASMRWVMVGLWMMWASMAHGQQVGGIRGTVTDADFGGPVAGATVQLAETGTRATTGDDGNYALTEVPPGAYTVIVSKEGFIRQVRTQVAVAPGRLTELNVALAGEFVQMEEFVVQDLLLDGGAEAALLALRMDSPALLDSIGADLLSRAGAGDAAAALNLVTGVTVEDGKYAVVRGLPDRYVNAQLNGIRLPTADADKRAVQLDQFPSAAIQSVRVSKTFTPDQQGDASGGAVNVILKGIPEGPVYKFDLGITYRPQVADADPFWVDRSGGLTYWGKERRAIPWALEGDDWPGAVGVAPGDPPTSYKWSLTVGDRREVWGSGLKVGGLASLFYKRDASFSRGIDDKYWVEQPGDPMTPQYGQGTPAQGEFKTALFDVERATQEVQWGFLGALGLETEDHALMLTYLYTRAAEEAATLAEDTRGKRYYFPGYDPDDPLDPGNQARDAAPYLRTETLQYTERVTRTFQLSGRHRLPLPEPRLGEWVVLRRPELEWRMARSTAELDQPDKRLFGEQWWGPSFEPGFPPFIPPRTSPPVHRPFKPSANFTLGNLQRVWKTIVEMSEQYGIDLKLPFELWNEQTGYLKVGVFDDTVARRYRQESFSNFNDNAAFWEGPFEDRWSERFPRERHPITAADIDVDYFGDQRIRAWYWMADVPITTFLRVVGGIRYETTNLSIINLPEKDVTWIPPGGSGQVKLNPGDADVRFEQRDALPSLGVIWTVVPNVTVRGSWSRTVARQTFKELTPIQQQEFLGGDVFIGNPFLRMSAVENYDLRVEYMPSPGDLVAVSYFRKDVTDPIEYVQRVAEFLYTTPINYPKGRLEGLEFEVRQSMGRWWAPLEGLALGANLTLIDSEVVLPAEEAAKFEAPNIQAPMKRRAMTNAPERLYNLYLTYDMDRLGLAGTQLNVFYSVRGDTLIAGAGQANGKFIPNVYAKEFGTLNVSLIKKFGDNLSLTLQAKNLLNPRIETVYRGETIGEDVTKASFRAGREFSIGLTYRF